ncbi:MAG: DNA-directed DNA polymerase [Methanotrichaceae archaeon]|nr:DNA-directed DNA polymerase [Methanotrichaceae archaeon]
MIFQILDTNYAYDAKGYPLIQLFGSTPEGHSVICRVTGYRPYFYAGVRQDRFEQTVKALTEVGLDVEEVELFEPIGYQTSPARMLKIITKDPKEVRTLREKVLEFPGIKAVYETDILFRNRFLIDRGLGGMAWAEAKFPEGISVKDATTIEKNDLAPINREANAPLRYLAFDIECLPDHGEMPTPEVSPIILISLAFQPEYNDLRDLVLVGKTIDCIRKDVRICKDERDLFYAFTSILRDFDPDIVVGYNSNEFDFNYLKQRAERLKVDIKVSRDGSPWYIRKIGNSTNVSMTGRVVVDLLPTIRYTFSLKQYTLRNAAAELLKMEKYEVNPKEIESLWEGEGDGLKRLISYARRDAVLALRLLLDLRLIDKYIALSRASGSLLQDIVNGGQSGMVENILLRRFRERNRAVPPKPDLEVSDQRYIENEELKGGAVLSPEKGLLENIIILDYKSLYPTIMMAHNLCYSTVVTGKVPESYRTINAPSGGKFVPPEISPGIVPAILRDLLDQRTETKRLMKQANEEERRFLDAKQNAMKILLNSFYGYSGYARARLYSLVVANAVTSFGRENILKTKELIDHIASIYVADGKAFFEGGLDCKDGPRRFDLSVVYGDTDSVFVRIKPFGQDNQVSLPDAELIGRKVAKTVTSSLPEPMELVFEGFARRAIFLAKKRYALWVFELLGTDWKDRIKVRGMETVRRDWCDLTSKTLNRCLELVLKDGNLDEAVTHVRFVINRLQRLDISRDSEILGDLTLTRRYTKSTASYKNKQPHIQLVEKMKKRGGHVPDVGERVPFVIIRGRTSRRNKELFVDRAEDPQYVLEKNIPLDTEYYIEKQILPPVLRIFEGFGVTKDMLYRECHQSNLLTFREDANSQKQKSLSDY